MVQVRVGIFTNDKNNKQYLAKLLFGAYLKTAYMLTETSKLKKVSANAEHIPNAELLLDLFSKVLPEKDEFRITLSRLQARIKGNIILFWQWGCSAWTL